MNAEVCEQCGSSTTMQVQVVVKAPSSFYGRLPKTMFRKSQVELLGVLWQTADIICNNPRCGHVVKGYGNYVSQLRDEIKQLREELEKVKQ